MAMIWRVIRSMAISPAGLRRSWSAWMVTTSGSSALVAKCLSAVA
jgi:hypothetical protein